MPTSSSYYDPAKYREAARVRIAARTELEAFLKTWKLHHPLQLAQLDYAGRSVKVRKSFMYHGGDILYELEGVPGIWHGQCLEAV